MDDLISRQAAIDMCRKPCMRNADCSDFEMEIMMLPPIQPRRGKWNRLDMDTFNCNKCGATFVLSQGSEKMHFCPNCGADMREVTG